MHGQLVDHEVRLDLMIRQASLIHGQPLWLELFLSGVFVCAVGLHEEVGFHQCQ